jgi:hypothetical protein
MKPKSHRERPPHRRKECGNCKHAVNPRGTLSLACGFGEHLTEGTLIEESHRLWRNAEAMGRYFDEASFSNEWFRDRYVDSSDICKQHEYAPDDEE